VAVVRAELESYGAGLGDKPEVIAISRADLVDDERLTRAQGRACEDATA
jgi:GTP-binding protein